MVAKHWEPPAVAASEFGVSLLTPRAIIQLFFALTPILVLVVANRAFPEVVPETLKGASEMQCGIAAVAITVWLIAARIVKRSGMESVTYSPAKEPGWKDLL